MNDPFYKAKFNRLMLEHKKYFIQVSSDGVFLTKMNQGAGEEKDCDIELSWDEIYDCIIAKKTLNTDKTANVTIYREGGKNYVDI